MRPYELNPMGHVWRRNDYNEEVDVFGYEEGEYHNGPVCVRCGYGFCHHCGDRPCTPCPGEKT
jgi:hypothetical protein